MNCLPCFGNKDDDKEADQNNPAGAGAGAADPATQEIKQSSSSSAQTFTFRELAMATKNFRQECLLGEGGFGRVFKGKLHSTGQVVAVKQLDRNGMQANKEFSVEVMMLSLLSHPNLVNLVGYCADGDQRLLVYEYMPMGSLENHLFGDGTDNKPLDWRTRMKIASGAASGLQYLHETANPPVIYRDLKPSNVLLDEDFEPKLSDFGLAKLGPGGGRNMGTYGYTAPEYSSNGELTIKSDIYSFGVILLELIAGKRVIDTTRPSDEQNLVTWAQPIFRDPKRFPEMADPRLKKQFPATSLNQAVGICAMCLQEEPMVRPFISDIVPALSFICMAPNDPVPPSMDPPAEQKMEYDNNNNNKPDDGKEAEEEEEDDEDEGSSSCSESGSGSESESEDDDYNNSRGHSSRQSDEEESGDSSSRGSSYHSEEGSDREDDEKGESRGKDNTSSKSSRQESCKKPKAGDAKRMSSRPKNKGSRQPVVTFKEPSISSRYSADKSSKEQSASSSDEGSSEENESSFGDCNRENGSNSEERDYGGGGGGGGCSSSDASESPPPPKGKKMPKKKRGGSVGSIQGEDGNGHKIFDKAKNDNNSQELKHLKTR